MKIDKRLLIESIVVPIFLAMAFFGWRMIQAYLLTRNDVPSVINNYESTDYLQSSVSFGVVMGVNWISVIIGIVGFSILLITYYMLRLKIRKRKDG